MKNVVETVTLKIQDLVSKRENEISRLEDLIALAAAESSKQAQLLDKATFECDADAYVKAKNEKFKQDSAREMYERRLKQVKEREMIKEEESDKVIDSLLEYEDELQSQYENEVKVHIKALKDLYDAYSAEVRKTERTIINWTNRIHANYRTPGTTYADGGHRSDKPKAVHPVAYEGGSLANAIGSFLTGDRVKDILQAE